MSYIFATDRYPRAWGLGLINAAPGPPPGYSPLMAQIWTRLHAVDAGTADPLPGIGGSGECAPQAIYRLFDGAVAAGTDPVSYLQAGYQSDLSDQGAQGFLASYQVCMAALIANGFPPPSGGVSPMVPPGWSPGGSGGTGGGGTTGGTGPGAGGGSGSTPPPAASPSSSWIAGVSNTAVMIGGAVLLVVVAVAMGGRH